MVIIHKVFVILLCLVVITSLSFTAFASGETPVGSSYQYQSGSSTSYSDYWTASSYNLTHIAQYLYPLTKTSYWYYNSTSSAQFGNFYDAVSQSLYHIGDTLRFSNTYLYNIRSYLSDLHDVFADSEDLALKNSQNSNMTSATSNFFSGNSSSTSVGVSDIGNMKSIGDDVATLFNTGVSGTSIFGLVSDTSANGPWSWFSQATLDSLSPSNSGQRRSGGASSSGEVVDFYSDKMAELNRLLGTVSKDD